MEASNTVTRTRVCGVDCHRGDANCNNYCHDASVPHPGTYEVQQFDFGGALKWLHAGQRISRSGWNGKGMFVYLVPPASYPVQTGAAKAHFGEGSMVPYNAYFAIKNVDDTVSTWVPSVNDCLAEDWQVVE